MYKLLIIEIMRTNNYIKSKIKTPKRPAGESLEAQLRRLEANKEIIPENVPPMYTPYSDGVLPETDIRTDRFDIACEAADKFAASETARTAEKAEFNETETNVEPTNNE